MQIPSKMEIIKLYQIASLEDDCRRYRFQRKYMSDQAKMSRDITERIKTKTIALLRTLKTLEEEELCRKG
jgi:hypothetical protein